MKGPEEQPPEALMAGTLCLMSCFADRPRSEFGRRIAENLRVLATDDRYSAELRTILARLSARWDRLAQALPSSSPATDDSRTSIH